MGRAPCCDKANVKKGPWSPEEDATLKSYIEQHGTGGNWIALPQKIGLKRCGKSCRLRWLNYLRPNIKHGGFSEEEDNIICSLYISIGSRWSIIAAQLPGRTDNDIKNYWNTRLKKKLLGKQRKEQKARRNASQNPETTRKERENYMISSTNQNPYWPNNQLHVLPPIPYSNEEPRVLNDHTSIRKLLMKLGGRFSNENQEMTNGLPPTPNVQCSVDNSLVSQLYQPQISSVLDTTNATLPDASQYTTVDPANMPVLGAGGGGGFASELEQIVYSTPQKIEGLEFLYGDIMMNARNGSSCGVNSDWDEMSSLVFPLVATNLDGVEQGGMIEEYATDHISYPGS